MIDNGQKVSLLVLSTSRFTLHRGHRSISPSVGKELILKLELISIQWIIPVIYMNIIHVNKGNSVLLLVLSWRTVLANLSRWREAAHPPHLLQRRCFLQVPCAKTSPDNKGYFHESWWWWWWYLWWNVCHKRIPSRWVLRCFKNSLTSNNNVMDVERSFFAI